MQLSHWTLRFLVLSLLPATFLLSAPSSEREQADQLFEKGDYREAIELYQQALKSLPKDQQSLLKEKMALTYYRDQEDEKAFKIYLEALDEAPKLSPPKISPDEQVFYNEALKLYLDGSGSREAANEIRQKYSPIIAIHPNYYHLNFILAAAYANLSMFDEFFERFYCSYQYFPTSYMAYKTKAILNLKLYEKTAKGAQRDVVRQQVYNNALKASEKNPQDASLYRILVTFSAESDHQKILTDTINKVISQNIIVPRNDILFYVKEAVDGGNPALAQRFIDQAKIWYSYSRTIELAQEYLESSGEKKTK